jgi:hypothetical protein
MLAHLRTAASAKELTREVGGCFAVATAISPLLMLHPKSYSSDAFRKDGLLAVNLLSFEMGLFLNSQPDSIVLVLPWK